MFYRNWDGIAADAVGSLRVEAGRSAFHSATYSSARECPGQASPPSFQIRGQLPGSIQPWGEMTPE